MEDSLSVERASSPNGFSEFDVTIDMSGLFCASALIAANWNAGESPTRRALFKN